MGDHQAAEMEEHPGGADLTLVAPTPDVIRALREKLLPSHSFGARYLHAWNADGGARRVHAVEPAPCSNARMLRRNSW